MEESIYLVLKKNTEYIQNNVKNYKIYEKRFLYKRFNITFIVV